jgi:hypothetical protein
MDAGFYTMLQQMEHGLLREMADSRTGEETNVHVDQNFITRVYSPVENIKQTQIRIFYRVPDQNSSKIFTFKKQGK